MIIKEKVLDLLEKNKGVYFSGEHIAQNLQVSRAAVWKAINALRKDGYNIEAANNRGYCLSVHTDILSSQGIAKYLEPVCSSFPIQVLSETLSTNSFLRQAAGQGAPEGCTVLAGAQTAGRGRSGRNFYSPKDSGIYMSILLRPEQYSVSQSLRITTMAAVAMCKAIEDAAGLKPSVKWVNDIFVNGKKVCGILTEGALSMETGSLEYAVLGVGVNVYSPLGGFPEELKGIAGALFSSPQNDMKNRLAAAFLNHFWNYYFSDSHREIVDEYRKYSLVIGKEIQVIKNGTVISAVADDIDEECRLSVTYPDGRKEKLSYGEIRICIP